MEWRIMAGNTPKLIFGYLFLLGIIAVGMILGSVFWLTSRIDQLEKESSESIVELLVTEKVAHVRETVIDYSYWNLAYELVLANDADDLYENLGVSVDNSEVFDQIIILNRDGQVLHLFDGTGTFENADAFDVRNVAPFLSLLQASDPADRAPVSGIGMIKSAYGAITASWIVPDYLETVDPASLPIMIGVKLFSDDVMQAIARLTQGTGYAIVPAGEAPSEPAVDLVGPDGIPVAQLFWSHKQVGTILRLEILPGILLVCLGIFGLCFFAARYFHQQSKALNRAMCVATTDKLTGLLNRSGFDEELAKPDVKEWIDAGHVAVIYLDLNDFKALNDQHGHSEGDHALRVVAQRLKSAVRRHDPVVRLGGDEFICVVFDRTPMVAAKAVSDRILVNCSVPISFAGFERVLAPSLGVAVGRPGLDMETLISQADAAMYRAKSTRRLTAEFHAPEEPLEPQTSKPQATIAA